MTDFLQPVVACEQVFDLLRRHGFVLWVVLPAMVVVQGLVPFFQPTCAAGVADASFIFLAGVLIYHLHVESQTWTLAKTMPLGPEMVVLRQFGVLRKRRRLVAFGILEIFSLYNDFTFPLMTLQCGASLTEKWADAWTKRFGADSTIVMLVRQVSFTTVALTCALATLAFGLCGLIRAYNTHPAALGPVLRTSQDYAAMNLASVSHVGQGPEAFRLPGPECIEIAGMAESCGMPSVAMLYQEVGMQRRHIYDQKGGALESARLRENILFGKANKEDLADTELRDAEEQRRVDDALQQNVVCLLFGGKILLCNITQIWLQAMFLEMAFDRLGSEAKVKFVARVCISTTHTVSRLMTCARVDASTVILSFLSMACLSWAIVKVVFIFICPSHSWAIIGGCADTAIQ